MRGGDTRATGYFDVVSPFAYLALGDVETLGRTLPLTYKPILFAALLKHHGHLGPAEIPSKRVHTYRQCVFEARRRGIELRFPPAHPFNPLRALRLVCALGAGPDHVRRVMEHVWREGHDPNEDNSWDELCRSLAGTPAGRAADAALAKDTLRRNTEEALERGVFGVPTLAIDSELFWGSDAMPMASAYLADPNLFRTGEMARVSVLPNAVPTRGGAPS